MKVAVIGMGKTGLPIAVALHKRGCEVVGVEIIKHRLEELGNPNWEPAEPQCSWEERKDVYLTGDIEEAIRLTDVALMIVQTPEETPLSGIIDVGPTKLASDQIGAALQIFPKPYTVIMSSTVMPGTCRDVISLGVGPTCEVVFNPVWIALGSVVKDYLNPPVSVLGVDAPPSRRILGFFEQVFPTAVPIITDTPTGEATKLVYNVWCTLKMAFVNEAAEVYRASGADPSVVGRFFQEGGERPGAFLRPGPPPGGPCFPRDLRFAHHLSGSEGAFGDLVKAIDRSNELRLDAIVEKVIEQVGNPSGIVGIVGLTYKPGVPVVEETISYELATELQSVGFRVIGYDPLVQEAPIQLTGTLSECIGRSAILVEMHQGAVPQNCELPVIRPWR